MHLNVTGSILKKERIKMMRLKIKKRNGNKGKETHKKNCQKLNAHKM